MPKIVFFHGLAGGPEGTRTAHLRRHFGDHNVYAPRLPFSWHSMSSGALPTSLGRVRELCREARSIALEAVSQFQPDVIVGISLGGAVAMMAASETTPMVLVCPAWTGRVHSHCLRKVLAGGNRTPTGLECALLPLVTTGLASGLARRLIGFDVPRHVGPRTLILHSPDDDVIDFEDSRLLLRNSPRPKNGPEAELLDAVSARLHDKGYELEDRLIAVGSDHRMIDNAALNAVADVVNELARSLCCRTSCSASLQ